MKKHLETIFGMLRSALLATITAAIIFGPTTVMAATNTANWDIGGAGQTGSTINLFSYVNGSVTLTKAAFLTDGTPLANNATVPQNTDVKFMIYVQNTNSFTMNDISIEDIINPAEFTFNPAASLTPFQIDNSQSDVASATDIYNAVNASATTATSAPADDIASFVGGTITVGSTSGDNVGTLDVPANTTWAILFTARVL